MLDMEQKKIEDLYNLQYSYARILVDYNEYDVEKDTRILIPFSYYEHYGLMNRDGVVVVEPKYDRILDSCSKESDMVRVGIYYTYGFNRASKEPSPYLGTKWGLVDSAGKFILKPEYKSIAISDSKKILTIQHTDGQYEVISIDGEVIIPKGKYRYIDSFDSGYARVNFFDGKNKRWGLIDTDGNEVLPLIYSKIWNFVGHNRTWITIECIDEHGNKRSGTFHFLTRKTVI